MKHRYLHARIARSERAVAPRMVRVVKSDGSIHFLACDLIMSQIAHDFDGCSAEVKNILQDAIAPKWLVLGRDTRWASMHPVDTDDPAYVEGYRVNQGKETGMNPNGSPCSNSRLNNDRRVPRTLGPSTGS